MISDERDGRAYLVLSSGRRLYAFHGIIGIGPDCSLPLYEGFDGELGEADVPLTADEQIEIADAMILRWQKFRDKVAKQ